MEGRSPSENESSGNKTEVKEPSPEEKAKIEANKKEQEKRQKENEDYLHAKAALSKHYADVVFPNASEWTFKGGLNDPDLADVREKFEKHLKEKGEQGVTGLFAAVSPDSSPLRDGVYGSDKYKDFVIIKQGDNFQAFPPPNGPEDFRKKFGAVVDNIAKCGNDTIVLTSKDTANVTEKYLDIAIEEIQKRGLKVRFDNSVKTFIESKETNKPSIIYKNKNKELNEKEIRSRVDKYEKKQMELEANSKRAFHEASTKISYERSKKNLDSEAKFTNNKEILDAALKVNNKELEGKEKLAALEKQVDILGEKFKKINSASENVMIELGSLNNEVEKQNLILSNPKKPNKKEIENAGEILNKVEKNFSATSKERIELIDTIKDSKQELDKHLALWNQEINKMGSFDAGTKEERENLDKLVTKIKDLTTEIEKIDPKKIEENANIISSNIQTAKDGQEKLAHPSAPRGP